MKTRIITKTALLAAAALIVFVIEAQIPSFIPVPGVKLGLANVFVLFALYALGARQAVLLLVCKVALGSVLSGNGIGFMYSAAGGVLCFLAMLGMKRLLRPQQVWVCSVCGAVGHNAGQLAVAVCVTRTWQVLAYAPVLLASGLLAGLATGVIAQLVLERLRGISK